MTAQSGRNMLIKVRSDDGAFVTVAGLRTKSLRFNARTVDITHSESVEAWRELLPGAGVKSAEISGSGIFRDNASDAVMRQAFFEQRADTYQFILPDFGIIEGPFLISGLNFAGQYDGEASYDLTLVSSGAPSFTPAVE